MRNYGKKAVLMAAAGMITAIAVTAVLGTLRVSGTAMEPSVADGSILFINKMAYFYREPEAGDVVAFRCNVYSEDEEGSLIVRRIAATEGDTVRITDGNLYVNDELYEDYSDRHIYMDPMKEITVGKNRVFVISDSRTAVLDSRDQAVGQLRKDELYGKVCFR